FFFPFAAPADIYTLSLHDALPIWPLPYGAPGEERAPEGVVRTPAAALAEAQALLDAGRPFHAHEVLEDAWKSAPEAERQLWRGLDRKSTRLNSSHVAISYAVFCLK